MGYPQVNLSGVFSTIGTATASTPSRSHFEFYDNVLIHRGNHTVQFGGYFLSSQFQPDFFRTTRAGLLPSMASIKEMPSPTFCSEFPSQAQVGIGEGAESAHTNWAHFYIQDGWQLTPKSQIGSWLRYEYNSNLVAAANQTSNIDLTAPGGPAFVVAGNLRIDCHTERARGHRHRTESVDPCCFRLDCWVER